MLVTSAVAVVFLFICGLIGAAVSHGSGAGFALGLIGGPLGILVAAIACDGRPKCRHCGGGVNTSVVDHPAACQHCGRDTPLGTRPSGDDRPGPALTLDQQIEEGRKLADQWARESEERREKRRQHKEALVAWVKGAAISMASVVLGPFAAVARYADYLASGNREIKVILLVFFASLALGVTSAIVGLNHAFGG